MKLSQHSRKALIVLGTVAFSLVSFPGAGQSQVGSPVLPTEAVPNSPAEALPQSQIVFNAPPPPNQGTPSGRAQGGASRGPCQDYEDLAALVPTIEGIVWGKTTQAAPSLWFYLPHPLTAETPIEFALQDAADNYVYQTSLTAPETSPGLIRFQVEPEAQPLQPDQLYTWTLIVYCDPAQPTRSVFVTGTLQQAPPDSALQAQLATAGALEQAQLYAANGIWHDALNILAEQYQVQPSDGQIATIWTDLLQQAGLEHLTAKPFSPCCGS